MATETGRHHAVGFVLMCLFLSVLPQQSTLSFVFLFPPSVVGVIYLGFFATGKTIDQLLPILKRGYNARHLQTCPGLRRLLPRLVVR